MKDKGVMIRSMALTQRQRRRYAIGFAVSVALIVAVLILQTLVTGVEIIDVDGSVGLIQNALKGLTGAGVSHLMATYGYAAVLVLVAAESMGLPLPGETMLLAAAIFAGTTHHLSLPGVIAAAAAGAIMGDNVGFLIGRWGGARLLRRYGPRIGLNERRLKLGYYLFQRQGGKVVFFGRFVAVLRMWAAFLAGAHGMPWARFLAYNAAGGLAWATVYALGGYLGGASIHRLTGPLGIATAIVAVVVLGASAHFIRRNERRLEEMAERALPGPLPEL